MQKARVSSSKATVKQFFQGAHCDFQVSAKSDITEEEVIAKLLQSGGAHKPKYYDFGDGSSGESQSSGWNDGASDENKAPDANGDEAPDTAGAAAAADDEQVRRREAEEAAARESEVHRLKAVEDAKKAADDEQARRVAEDEAVRYSQRNV